MIYHPQCPLYNYNFLDMKISRKTWHIVKSRKKQLKEKDGEIIHLSKLTNKDVKAATINILKDLMENMITLGNLHRYMEMLLKKKKGKC